MATLCIILGVEVSFGISIALSLLYLGGFIYLIRFVKHKTKDYSKIIHFNLSLALRNENDNYLKKFRVKARPGFMSKWIEYHIIKDKVQDKNDL